MKNNKKPIMIATEKIRPFEGHPYKVNDDEEMNCLTESIRTQSVLTPLIVRSIEGTDEYEMISGHRRLYASVKAGKKEVPAIVHTVSRDEAAVMLVDSNLHREHILPSEKAFSYKLKLEAIKHQGVASRQTDGKSESADMISDQDSGRQVQRYIRLTKLIPEILEYVDDGKMALTPAVEISYLSEQEQFDLLDAMEQCDCTPSHAQAIRLKKLSQDGLLNSDRVYEIISEEKPNQQEQIKLKRDEFKKYFPSRYTAEQIKQDILKGLELLKRQRDRNRESR